MILVTGASGFIGRSLTNRLTLEGRPWKAYKGHINDPIGLREQLDGVETIYHLAGAESRGRARFLQRVDVDGTKNLIILNHQKFRSCVQILS